MAAIVAGLLLLDFLLKTLLNTKFLVSSLFEDWDWDSH
jgi:hypothetical protein